MNFAPLRPLGDVLRAFLGADSEAALICGMKPSMGWFGG